MSALELSAFSSQTWNYLYKWNIFQNLQVYECKNKLIYYETVYLRTTAAARAADEAGEPILMGVEVDKTLSCSANQQKLMLPHYMLP